MFAKELLVKLAEDAVQKEEELSHLEETGTPLVHFDFEILKTEQPIFYSGRSGDYYKFTFEYRVTLLDEKNLADVEDEVRMFRRTVRLTADGKISGIGDRVEIFA
jgi:hypothetical protein